MSNNILRSNTGGRLVLTITVMVRVPGRFTMLIRDDAPVDNNAVRLDARAHHRNHRTDGRSWTERTHLHLYTAGYGTAHAEDPSEPWPPDGWSETRPRQWVVSEIERAFETFCQMFAVAFRLPQGDTAWTDPDLTARPVSTDDGEEIP